MPKSHNQAVTINKHMATLIRNTKKEQKEIARKIGTDAGWVSHIMHERRILNDEMALLILMRAFEYSAQEAFKTVALWRIEEYAKWIGE